MNKLVYLFLIFIFLYSCNKNAENAEKVYTETPQINIVQNEITTLKTMEENSEHIEAIEIKNSTDTINENKEIFIITDSDFENAHKKEEEIFYKIADKYPHIPDDIKTTVFQWIFLNPEFNSEWVQKLFNYLNYNTPRPEDKNQTISLYSQYCLYNDMPEWIQEEMDMSFFDYLFESLEDQELQADYKKKFFVSYSTTWDYYCDDIIKENWPK